MKSAACLVPVFVFMTAFMTNAQAATVAEFVSFDLTTTASATAVGGGPKAMQERALNPFDSSLGQLDEVRVSALGGLLTITGTSGRHGFRTVLGDFVPLPYTISPTVKIGIRGVTDFFNITRIDNLYNRPAPGETAPFVPVADSFSFNFRIDEVTELGAGRPLNKAPLAGGIPTSVPLYSGKRSDFLDTEIISDLLLFSLELDIITTMFAPVGLPTTLNARLRGNLQVDYIYTPVTDPVSAVPVPAAVYLFGTALIGLIGLGKRKARMAARTINPDAA